MKKFSKERKYKLLQDYRALEIPFLSNESNKTYKKNVEVTVDKYLGDYLKVKGEGKEVEGHWIAKSAMEGENKIVIKIERQKYNDHRTVGTINVDNGEKVGYTLELQKGSDSECKSICTDTKKSEDNCHRIIKGKYDFSVTSYSSNTDFINKSLRLASVPGREGILIHRGVNARIWSYGCILAMRNDPTNDADDAMAEDRANTVTDSEDFCIELVDYINDRTKEIKDKLGYDEAIMKVEITEVSETNDQ